MKIVSRWDSSKVLWDGECDNIREELIAAVKAGASLDGASLDWASLVGASLDGASLDGASLDGASLVGASLDGASLVGASLDGASLVGASLVGASLVGASLVRASLDGASLDGASGINPLRFTPLLMLLDQPGAIRAYKLVNADGSSPQAAALGYTPIIYAAGESYEVTGACTDIDEHCAAGISVATLDWCMRDWCPGQRIIIVEFEAADIAAIPTATDGKFRLHRCRVVGEKDLVEIGLVKPDAAEVAR